MSRSRFVFKVPGKPGYWPRAGVRVVKPGKGKKPFATHYETGKAKSAKEIVRGCMVRQAERLGIPIPVFPAGAPISARVMAVYPLAESRHLKRSLREAEWKRSKPDADNVAKLVLDALNGFAYQDDSQVVDLRVTKTIARQGVDPFTMVILYLEGRPAFTESTLALTSLAHFEHLEGAPRGDLQPIGADE